MLFKSKENKPMVLDVFFSLFFLKSPKNRVLNDT
nr:MAG TPA: hypothetical protein [Bacteriophage sp.]